MDETLVRPRLAISIAIGVFAGALSGLFGVGGGILIVPALAIVGRMDQRLAHGTSLAATAPLAAAGLAGYALAGEVDWLVAALMLSGSVVGALLGTHLLHRLPREWLRWGFSILLIATAVRMLIETPAGLGRGAVGVGAGLGLGSVGLFSGSIAGLMGVGGGIVMVPAQSVLFAVPAALAKGTSLAVIVPTALVGTVQNLRRGNADVPTAAGVGAAGVVTSFLASAVSVNLDPTVSAVSFGILLVAAAVRLMLRRPAAAGSDGTGQIRDLAGASPGEGEA